MFHLQGVPRDLADEATGRFSHVVDLQPLMRIVSTRH